MGDVQRSAQHGGAASAGFLSGQAGGGGVRGEQARGGVGVQLEDGQECGVRPRDDAVRLRELEAEVPAERDGEGPRGIALVKGNTYPDKQNKFFDQVYQKAVKTPDQELFMFTPGYMSTFESTGL